MPGAFRSLGLLLIGGAVLALLRGAAGRPSYIDASTGLPDVAPEDVPSDESVIYDAASINDATLWSDDAMSNLDALLWAIRLSEHLRADVIAGEDYRTFYGGARFSDFSDHPVITGELKGVPLPPEWCRRAGYASGICVSTAAGAYQFNVPTWNEVRSWGGPTLTDFTPESQDEAARRLLRKIGAAQLVEAGDLAGALEKAAPRWASLPSSRAGQNKRSIDYVVAAYNEGLSQGTA